MAKAAQKGQAELKYRRVEITSILTGRRGKHHDLAQGILEELAGVKPGMALQIPLGEVNGIGLANLRSAVHRACMSEGIAIETRADDENLYLWKTTSQ